MHLKNVVRCCSFNLKYLDTALLFPSRNHHKHLLLHSFEKFCKPQLERTQHSYKKKFTKKSNTARNFITRNNKNQLHMLTTPLITWSNNNIYASYTRYAQPQLHSTSLSSHNLSHHYCEYLIKLHIIFFAIVYSPQSVALVFESWWLFLLPITSTTLSTLQTLLIKASRTSANPPMCKPEYSSLSFNTKQI